MAQAAQPPKMTFNGTLMAATRSVRRMAAHESGALSEPDSWAAIRLTLLVAAISVPLNVIFGGCAAWAIAEFNFRGKSLLIQLLELPFSGSPVGAGLIFVGL